MAIQFARCEYVSRSTGANACRKSAYNARTSVKCERVNETFSFSKRDVGVFHEVLLPLGADPQFKDLHTLWNAVENAEKRKDSQVAKEIVLALPDNKEISLSDRIELCKRFAETYFVSKGVAIQMDIHGPHGDEEKNWHAHLLIATRRFDKSGNALENKKARDLDPEVRFKKVVEADIWGEHWRDLQNAYFKERGISITVDAIGIVGQEHLGPVRMRKFMSEALERAEELKQANKDLASDPESILGGISRNKAVFTNADIDRFIQKHTYLDQQEGMMERVLDLKNVIPLYDKDTEDCVGYTIQETRVEEARLMRFATRVANQERPQLDSRIKEQSLENLTISEEQIRVFDAATSDQNLTLIQGRAGVGKSYVLTPIREAHEKAGYRVIGLSPTHKLVQDMKQEGFENTQTVHGFLFGLKNQRAQINRDTLLVVDEAAMLSTPVMLELFHKVAENKAKLLLVGDAAQIQAIERGGMFTHLAETFGSHEIADVRRQTVDWQREMSMHLARGETREAVSLLKHAGRIHTENTQEETLTKLMQDWIEDYTKDPNPKAQRFVLAHTNAEVDALNYGIREGLKQRGLLEGQEWEIQTNRGRERFMEGDRVQLTETDRHHNLHNGTFGTIVVMQDENWMIHMDRGGYCHIDPAEYRGIRHGYAGTIYKAQGATLDKTYILHSPHTNQNNTYVALTRQTQDLGLYVSRNQTPTTSDLVRQISRTQDNTASLSYLTEKELETHKASRDKERNQTPFNLLKQKAQTKTQDLLNTVKDFFYENKQFYIVPEKPRKEQGDTEIRFPVAGRSTKEIESHVLSRLKEQQDCLEKNTVSSLEKLQLCTSKTTLSLVEHYERTGENPTRREAAFYVRRAEYEMQRADDISQARLASLSKERRLNKSDCIEAQMYAERRATIEGRHYFEAMSSGNADIDHRSLQAKGLEEITRNADTQYDLTQKFQTEKVKGIEEPLSKNAAERMAVQCMRYVERTGHQPNGPQLEKFRAIAEYAEGRMHELNDRYTGLSKYEKIETNTYLCLKETESLLKNQFLKDMKETLVINAQEEARRSLEIQNLQNEQQLEQQRQHKRELTR